MSLSQVGKESKEAVKVTGKVTVEEFTTPDPITADVETRLEELMLTMKENGVRHIPITQGNLVVGLVSERDLKVVSVLTNLEKNILRAKDIMVVDPVTVPLDTPLEAAAFKMSEQKIGSVMVNDENGKFYGIFTATDALNALIEILRQSSR